MGATDGPRGLAAVYERTPTAYPPLGTILLTPIGTMCPTCATTANPTIQEMLVLRLLCTGFDLLNTIILFRLGCRARGPWAGVGIAALYCLFPTMPLVSGWWSQNDSWYIFFMLLAGIRLTQKRAVSAWVFLALATLVKLQAVILLPALAAGTWRWYGWRRLVAGMAGFALALGLVCTPILLVVPAGRFVSAITLPILQGPSLLAKSHITLGAHNVWAGLALLRHVDIWASYIKTIAPGITFYIAGMGLLPLGLALVALAVFWRSSPKLLFAGMALTWITFFQLASGTTMRYLLPAIVFLSVAALEFPIWWLPCLLLSAATLFNLQDTAGALGYPFPQIPLPGGIATNVVLMLATTLLTWGLFFRLAGHPVYGAGSQRATRLERGLAGVGFAALLLIMGLWVQVNAAHQLRLERIGAQLERSLEDALNGAGDVLVINWPKQITTGSSGGVLSARSGIFLPSLETMDGVSVVIYPPWKEMVNQAHRWDATYDGVYSTAEDVAELALPAQRVITVNTLTDAPQVWRLVERVERPAGAGLAQFNQQVELIAASAEYRERIVFVHLDWGVTGPLADSITVLVHLLGPTGEIVAQADGDPVANLLPLGRWYRYPDQVLRETRAILLPAGAPDGVYRVAVGLYDRVTLERLPVVCARQACENQAVLLDPIQVP